MRRTFLSNSLVEDDIVDSSDIFQDTSEGEVAISIEDVQMSFCSSHASGSLPVYVTACKPETTRWSGMTCMAKDQNL